MDTTLLSWYLTADGGRDSCSVIDRFTDFTWQADGEHGFALSTVYFLPLLKGILSERWADLA